MAQHLDGELFIVRRVGESEDRTPFNFNTLPAISSKIFDRILGLGASWVSNLLSMSIARLTRDPIAQPWPDLVHPAPVKDLPYMGAGETKLDITSFIGCWVLVTCKPGIIGHRGVGEEVP